MNSHLKIILGLVAIALLASAYVLMRDQNVTSSEISGKETAKSKLNESKVEDPISDASSEEIVRKNAPATPPNHLNYFEDTSPLAALVENYQELEDTDIENRIKEVIAAINDERLIERANDDELDVDERKRLAQLLNEESALKLVRAERLVKRVERETL